MEIGTIVCDQTGRLGRVVKIGKAGPDNDRLISVSWSPDFSITSFHWRTEFMATDKRVKNSTVWSVNR